MRMLKLVSSTLCSAARKPEPDSLVGWLGAPIRAVSVGQFYGCPSTRLPRVLSLQIIYFGGDLVMMMMMMMGSMVFVFACTVLLLYVPSLDPANVVWVTFSFRVWLVDSNIQQYSGVAEWMPRCGHYRQTYILYRACVKNYFVFIVRFYYVMFRHSFGLCLVLS